MSNEAPDNLWLQEAIARAKQSALPSFLEAFIEEDGPDLESMCDAVEVALLSITGTVTPEKLYDALRVFAEPYAQTIDAKWETVADAILAMLEWTPTDHSTHTLDSWGGAGKRRS